MKIIIQKKSNLSDDNFYLSRNLGIILKMTAFI